MYIINKTYWGYDKKLPANCNAGQIKSSGVCKQRNKKRELSKRKTRNQRSAAKYMVLYSLLKIEMQNLARKVSNPMLKEMPFSAISLTTEYPTTVGNLFVRIRRSLRIGCPVKSRIIVSGYSVVTPDHQ